MGTRSFIAINENNTFKGIYCHWDGYLEHNGKILTQHYTDINKIRELINLGDLSTLAEEIGTKHNFDAKPKNECNFYGRDREEKNIETKITTSLLDMQHLAENMGIEYFYLYQDNQWHVASRGMQFFGGSNGEKVNNLMPLTEAILIEAKEEE